MTAKSQDEPLQLIEFIRDDAGATTTIQLKEDTIDRVFQKIGDLPISVMCVCGPSRQGKSFLLGYMIRCLEGLENDEEDWMDWQDKKKPLKGFKFRNGTSPETQGIWVWSRPFIVKNDEGEDVAVLLVDTQGTNDEFTTNKDMSAIVGLSLLTSSVMIFNFFKTLQEDILSALGTYIQYGSLALDKGQGSGPPFQKLNFLIRDWNNPGQHAYGDKGGKLFLDEKLKIKDGQSPEAQHVRKEIKKCFQELDCFLMPNIGEKALFPEFQGSIDELDPKFAKELEKFINNLISSESLTTKDILGKPVTASELRSSLETYVGIFNSDEVPSAEIMWQATSQMSNNNEVERAVKKYRDFIKKKLRGNSYLKAEDLEKAHAAGAKQAMEMFKKAKKIGGQEIISEFEEKLEHRIKAEFSDIKKQNKEKRQKMVTGATNDTADAFKSQLEDDFPFKTSSEFYEESKIKKSSAQAKTEYLEEFKEKVSNEGEDELDALVQRMEGDFEAIVATLINKNRANRADAEKQMNLLVNELASSHWNKLQKYFDSNRFDADETALQSNHKKLMSTIVGDYEQRSKPGNKGFQTEYLSQLEADMANNFANLNNEQTLHIHEAMNKAVKSIRELSNDYEVELREALGGNEVDENQLKSIHSMKGSSTLQIFLQQIPFPRGSPLNNELETKLKEQLQQVFEKIKFEVGENTQRSLESYQTAMGHALNFYKTEMKGIAESDDLITEEDLEEEHKRISQEAMKEYEAFSKIGAPDNALDIKYELKNSLIVKEWERIQNECKLRRELAISQAKNFLSTCEAEYNKLIKKEMDSAKSVEELLEGHKRARAGAVDELKKNCPLREPTIIKKYEEELVETIEEIFEELQDVFELKMTEEETATRGMLTDARKGYHDEMGKHCQNDFFMTPKQLEALHGQVKGTVLKKCEKLTPLSHVQKAELEKAMDDLLENQYKMKNDMLLNSGDMGVAPAIGIDLGTTYCCVAVFVNGKVHIIPNQEQGGNKTTPSYVAFNPDGSESYGLPAKENAYKNPENTIYDAKRIIGRKITDVELQGDMDFWPFLVKEDQGIPKVMVNGKLLHPEQISAKLLAQFRVMAESYLKLTPGTIRNAVITVPAYFNDGQRQATVDAGELAGYEKVLTILNEPTAAAMAYSLERFDTDPKKILIYDLGGGTFDVAVLDMRHREIVVLGVKGDTHLGGEDFDKKLMEFCASSFKAKTGHDLFAGKNSTVKQERDEARRRLRRLQTHCEKAKRDLASARSTRVSVDAIVNGLDLTVDLTRGKFEELNMPFFEKSIRLVGETLQDVGLRKDQIDDVVLVGGSSRIPKVQEMLETFFNGKALNKSIDPDTAVAYGAAVQAALMNGEQAKDKIDFSQIQDVTPMSIGVEIYGGGFSVIVPKNTKIPVKAQERYRTAHNNQTSVQVTIYQGEKDIAVHNKHLGDFYLNGIPPKDAEVENIDVEMVINAQGILHVNAVCSSTGEKTGVTVTESKQRMTRALIKRLLADGEATPA